MPTAPSTGAHCPIDKHIIERFKNMDSKVSLAYPKSTRTVTNLWPAATSDSPPSPRVMAYTVGFDDTPMWPEIQHRVHNESKNDFFINAASRVPPAIWLCPPEVSTAAATTRVYQEIIGEPDPHAARQLMAGAGLDDWMSIASSYWSTALTSYRSCGMEKSLDTDFKINFFLGAAELLLAHMERENTQAMPHRPTMTTNNLQAFSIPHDTMTHDYLGPDDTAILHIQAMDGHRRSNVGLFSDTLYHLLCIDCMDRLPSYNAIIEHDEPGHCPSTLSVRVCGECNVNIGTKEAAKIHHMTVCRRPAGRTCPVCGGESLETAPATKSLTTPCLCAKNATLFWDNLRNLISLKTNKLLTTDNLRVLRALLFLHLTAQIDFAPQPRPTGTWWRDKAVSRTGTLMTVDDFQTVANLLPTVRHEGGTVEIPAMGASYTLQELVDMVHSSTLTPDSLPTSRSTSPDRDLQWDSYTTTPQRDIRSYRDAFISSTKEDKVKTYKDALTDIHILGNLMAAHLVEGREDLKTKLFNMTCGVQQGEQKPLKHSRPSTPHTPTHGAGPGSTTHTGAGTGAHANTFAHAGAATGATPSAAAATGSAAATGGHTSGATARPKVAFGRKSPATIICANESHTIAPTFHTETEKLTHLIQAHTCPYKLLVNPPCKKYYEYDSEMSKHINSTHVTTDSHNCDLCNMSFPTVAARDYHVSQSHIICPICRIFFRDYAALQSHNTPHACTDVAHLRPPERTTTTHLTPIAKTELDVFRQVLPDPSAELSNSLSIMASAIPGIPDQIRSELVQSFAQYAALNKALNHYEKYPAKARSLKRSLLQCPNFTHEAGSRETLSKASDFLSKLDTWEPIQSSKFYFSNFLKLQEINLAVTRATQACALTERSATALLLQKYSPETLVQLESMMYSPPQSWSYSAILNMSQNLFFTLDLEDLAIAAESARKLPAEKFHDFFARIYTLLSTASLGRPEKERIKYISSNMRRLSLRAAPHKVKLRIEQLELSHGIEYSAQDIADLVRSEEALHNPPHESQEITLLGAYKVSRTQSQEESRRTRTRERRINRVGDPTTSHQNIPTEAPRNLEPRNLPTRESALGEDYPDRRTADRDGTRLTNTNHRQQDNDNYNRRNIIAQDRPRGQFPPGNRGRQGSSRPFTNWQHQGPPRQSSPGPYGPTLSARDMYKSAQNARARALYVAEQKKMLDIPEDDQTRFCWNCGAGHPKLNGRMGEFHSRGNCPTVPYSTELHSCPTPWNGKLFHLPSHCPFQSKNKLSNVIRIIDQKNSH